MFLRFCLWGCSWMVPFFTFSFLCNAPSSYKSTMPFFFYKKTICFWDFFMIDKLGTRAWKLTILIRFYIGSYTICLWAANSDSRIPPRITIVYWFFRTDVFTICDPIMQRFAYRDVLNTNKKKTYFMIFRTLSIYIYNTIYIYI